jgi:hypothetical protein
VQLTEKWAYLGARLNLKLKYGRALCHENPATSDQYKQTTTQSNKTKAA